VEESRDGELPGVSLDAVVHVRAVIQSRCPPNAELAKDRATELAAERGHKDKPKRVPMDIPRSPSLVVSTVTAAPITSTVARQSEIVRSITASTPSATMRAWYSTHAGHTAHPTDSAIHVGI
jgi:hypothetical protein